VPLSWRARDCQYTGGRGATLIQRRLVDKLLFFVAPKIIGGDGTSVVGVCGVQQMEQAIRLRDLTGQGIGEDFLLQAYLA